MTQHKQRGDTTTRVVRKVKPFFCLPDNKVEKIDKIKKQKKMTIIIQMTTTPTTTTTKMTYYCESKSRFCFAVT